MGTQHAPERDARVAERARQRAVPTDPRFALRFLAKVYTTAQSRKVLNTLPEWITPDEQRVFAHRNASPFARTVRESVLSVVVADLIADGELAKDTPTGEKDLQRLFQLETTLGTSLIEETAAKWMQKTLAAQRAKLQTTLGKAVAQRVAVSRAAALVQEKVATTFVSIREQSLYSVLHPDHQRYWRDGTMEERLLKIRYILASRACVQGAKEEALVIRESEVKLPADMRMTTRQPEARLPSTARDRRDLLLVDARLSALQIVESFTWHPKAVRIVDDWAASPARGEELLRTLVGESVKAVDDLSVKLAAKRETVWRFPAALRAATAELGVEKDTLTYYALAWARVHKPALDSTLELLGDVLTLVEIYGGPLAPVAAVADAIVQAASAAVSFLHQLDQDHAETATEFEQQSDRLSTGGKYIEPVVQGVGALLAAQGIPAELRKLGRGKAAVGQAVKAPIKQAAGDVRAVEERAISAETKATRAHAAERPPTGAIPPERPATAIQPASRADRFMQPGIDGSGPAEVLAASGRRKDFGDGAFAEEVADRERLVGVEPSVAQDGIGTRNRRPANRAEPSGKASGATAEAWQAQGATKAKPDVDPSKPQLVLQDYTKLDRDMRGTLDEKLQKNLARERRRRKVEAAKEAERLRDAGLSRGPSPAFSGQALEDHIAGIESAFGRPIRELKEIEFSVYVSAHPYLGDATKINRRFDRVEREGRFIKITETKGYLSDGSALDFGEAFVHDQTSVRRQLSADAAVLEQYDYAKFEYYIAGRVTKEGYAELQALNRRFGDRFTIKQGPGFAEVSAETLRQERAARRVVRREAEAVEDAARAASFKGRR